ncbi:YadA-like family protein [Moraxella sp. FZLJ2107]|uniref:ESPR-type extended signal peptide-containing protein n=1 Tax=unclassified Moraxella TaxID=2685852 RepID=UPI0020C8444E|nr:MULTISPECIES: ESPR-type extended signal peptide-containing protein [unclassified Moraxella]UTO04614.1 YadA-like family protein [Moraxella sp. FZLJ2107]UTO21342.1 YadA-like family protein [Moraxella sp. FZLJ2109]
MSLSSPSSNITFIDRSEFMNKAFKVIWNHATQSWTAVSEIARAKGKTKSVKTAKTAVAVAVTAGSAMMSSQAMAAAAANTPISISGNDIYIATDADGNTAFGKNAYATNPANTDATLSLAIGANANASGNATTAVGQSSLATGDWSMAIGIGATATGSNDIAIGEGAKTSARYAVAIGKGANATGGSALAMGYESTANNSLAIALGDRSLATGYGSYAGSAGSKALKDYAVAIGASAEANATEGSVAVGWSAGVADGATSGLALGGAAKVNGVRGVAIGRSVHANGTYSVAVGTGTAVRGDGSSTVGYSNVVGSTSSDVSAFGSKNLIGATATFASNGITQSASIADTAAVTNSKVVGNNNYISSSNTYVLGSGVGVKDDGTSFMDTVENSVYLGNDSTITSSTATIDATTAGTVKNLNTNGDAGATSTAGSKGTVTEANVSGLVYGDFAGATSVGAVSVGASGSERRIVNMAAGEISATSTDAINGSQLYAVADKLGGQVFNSTYFHVNNASASQGAGDFATNLGNITDKAGARGQYSVTAGVEARALADYGIAIGKNANSTGSAVVIGVNASATGLSDDPNTPNPEDVQKGAGGAVAIGEKAMVEAPTGSAPASIAIGSEAHAKGAHVSNLTTRTGEKIAVGTATVIGANAKAIDAGVAIGQAADAGLAQYATAVGVDARALGDRSTAIGFASRATLNQTTAVGVDSKASSIYASAFGYNSTASNQGASALGVNTIASGNRATAVGFQAKATGDFGAALGAQAQAAYLATASGTGAEATAEGATANGYRAVASGINSLAVARSAKATETNATALGRLAVASHADAVALGSGSITRAATSENTATVNGVTYGGFAGNAPKSVVSFGKAGEERQLVNVAAGNISATSTDAINGSQLYLVTKGTLDQFPVIYTDVDGNKLVKAPDGNFYPEDTVLIDGKYYPKGTTPEQVADGTVTPATPVDAGDVIASMNDGDNVADSPKTLANVKGNLTPTYNVGDMTINVTTGVPSDVASTEYTKSQKGPNATTAAAMYNNAATVGDILNAGWNLQGKGEAVDFVKPYDTVNFENGTGTTVNITSDGNVSTIKVDVDTSTLVGNITYNTNGTVSNGTAGGDKLANVSTVVDAINKSGFTLKSSAVTGGEKDKASTDPEVINPGDVVEMIAGKNMTVKQEANGKITYATAENVSFTNVTVTSKLPTDDIKVGDAGNKTETQILNLTSANPDSVVTAKDLANYGWIVATPNNSYDAAVKSQDQVNFIGDGGVVVNGKTNATTGAYDVVVKLSAAGAVEIANMTTANGTTEPSGKLAVDENETGFVTAGNVVNIINQSGWRTNSTTATVTAEETLVNPGDQVNFEAGNNMQVTQEINTTTGVISYTYATKDDLVLNSTTVNSTTIGGSYTNEAGDVIKTSPITIMTTPEGKNVITNLTTVLPPTTSFNITNDAGEVVTAPNKAAPITAQEAQNIANTSGSNAATLGDVLNAGWNLQGNGDPVDFVKPYDTVNFKNGEGTTAVVSSDGNVSTIQYNVNVDGKTTQITYADADGITVKKVGDKFYNPADLNADGTPKADAKPVENVVSQISAIGPKVNGSATTGNINFANSTTANISYNSTTGDVKVEVVTGDTTVENGQATVKKGDEGKIATVGDIVETINNVSWNATAGKVAGSTGEVEGNAAAAVKAGDTVTLNAGNNIRIEQKGQTFNISTTDNVSFKNMNVTGNTTLGNLTVQPNSTVNMGGNVITNVGAGKKGTDAVNLNQLNASVAAAKTEVTSTDKTVTVTQKSGTKGQTIYDLSVKTDSTTIKPNATTGALEVVTGKTTTTKDGKAGLDGANATDIATVGDIVKTINNVSWNATAGKVADTNGEVDGSASTAVKAGDTVTLNAGNNIRIEQKGKTFNISTTENVSFTTANATTVNVGGDAGNTALTTVAGGNYNSAGQKIDDTAVPALSVGGSQITNVANGAISPSSTDAINGSQLYNIQANNDKRFGDVYNRIDDLDDGRKAGAASAMAAAGLPQAYREGQSGVVAAIGQYEGESAVAVGFTSISDNGKWLFRGAYSTNTQNENAGNLGLGYFW